MPDVFDLKKWAEAHKAFWDDVEKNGLKLPVIDSLVRNQWPESKPIYDPEKNNDYLLWCGGFEQAKYHPDGYFHNFVGGCAYEFGDEVVYWWKLPEVTE